MGNILSLRSFVQGAKALVRGIAFSAIFSIIPAPTFAQSLLPHTFMVEGRLFNNGTPLDETVDIKVEIYAQGSPGCILYREIHTGVDLDSLDATSKGYFSLPVGTIAPDYNGSASLAKVFANSENLNGEGGCTVLKASLANAHRYMKMSFKRPSLSYIPLSPDTVITSIPTAMVADTLSGKAVDEFVQLTGAMSQANALDVLGTRYTALDSLLDGTSSSYVQPSAALNDLVAGTSASYVQVNTKGASLPLLAADPAGAVAGQMWYDSANNVIKYKDNTATIKTLGVSGGSVTSVTAGTGLSGGTITATGTISMPNVGTAGTYTKVTTDTQGRVSSGTTLVESDIPTLSTAGKVSGNAINTGIIGGNTSISTSGSIGTSSSLSGRAFDVYDSTNPVDMNFVRIQTPATAVLMTNYTLTLPDSAGVGGQYLTTDGSGNLSWTIPPHCNANEKLSMSAGPMYSWSCITDADAVTSVFGRTGAVVAAASDYSADKIDNTAAGNIVAANVQDAVNELDDEKVAKAGDTMTGHLKLNSQSELRLADADSSNYVAFKAPSTASTDYTYIFPDSYGSGGSVLTSGGDGTLSWTTPANGDIIGITTNPGSGLSGGAASGTPSLQVVVDGSTLQINGSNQLEVKTGGIAPAQLATDSVIAVKIKDGAVTNAKIAGLSVSKLSAGAGEYLTYQPSGTPCNDGQVLKWDAVGTPNGWKCYNDNDTNTDAVTTVFGRSGAVVGAANDYTAGMITNNPGGAIASNNVQGAITELDNEKLPRAGGTMTGDLSIANLNRLVLQDSTSHEIGIRAPSSGLGANYNLILPVDDGGANQVLMTNGSGALSWVNNITGITASAGSGLLITGTGALTLAVDFGTGSDQMHKNSDIPHCSSTDKLEMSAGPVYSWSCVTDQTAAGTIAGITAGNGLTGGGTSGTVNLDVKVDNSTIELVSDAVQVKDSGITNSKLANNAVTDPKVTSVGVNKIISGSGAYFTYMPGNTECAQDEVLKWNSSTNQWICGADNTTALTASSVNSTHIADGTIKKADVDSTSIGVWDASGADAYRSTGKVAIGTATANEVLTVAGAMSLQAAPAPTAVSGYGKLYVSNANGKLYYRNELGVDKDLTLTSLTDAAGITIAADNDNNGTGDIIFATSNLFKMYISNAGKVGIGTNSPTDLLHISSTSGAATEAIGGAESAQSVINLITKPSLSGLGSAPGNGNKGYQLSAFGNTYGTTSNQNDFAISYWDGTTMVDRFHIDSAGNVGINTNNPAFEFDVVGDGRFSGTLKVEALAAATSTQLCINGNVLASCSSSIRYKENVQELSPSLDTILSLRPVTYDWKESKIHDLGFIAEEVEKIDSNLVTYNKNNQIQGVKYDQITAPLVKAFQELYEMLMGTRNDVDALKNENADLKRELATVKAENAAIRADSEQTKARLDRIERQLQSK